MKLTIADITEQATKLHDIWKHKDAWAHVNSMQSLDWINSPNFGVCLPVDDGSAANEPDRIADLEAAHNEMVTLLAKKDARIAELEANVERLKCRDTFAARAEAELIAQTFPANALKHSV